MKELITKILLGFIKKDQLIGLAAGILISVSAAFLGMTSQEVKSSVCNAPVVTLPSK